VSAPQLDRQCAREILALVSAAKVHAPGSELAWLVGWAMRAAGEPVARDDERPSAKVALAETERALRGSLPPGE
jgi:hypothetical protein